MNKNSSGKKYISDKEGKKVLIVEDDLMLSNMYLKKFEIEGFSPIVARDGAEALEVVLNERVDIVLLDMVLPRMSGIDFLKRLRQNPRGERVPVIALTNLAEDKNKEKAVELGVVEYLIKAMQTPEMVIEIVKKYI